MPPAASTPAYRRLNVEERRSQLLEAALTLFAHRAPE
ncbi:TetR family transcriptional regulator, partial [Streptomyces sp. MBT65]|nr:TetR family transcriptional regulator [Streptomyces sp. MBT65]